jgi:hypothetical protein
MVGAEYPAAIVANERKGLFPSAELAVQKARNEPISGVF